MIECTVWTYILNELHLHPNLRYIKIYTGPDYVGNIEHISSI